MNADIFISVWSSSFCRKSQTQQLGIHFGGKNPHALLRSHSFSCWHNITVSTNSTEPCKLIEYFRMNFKIIRRRVLGQFTCNTTTLLGTTQLSHTTPWLTISRRNYYFYILRRLKNQEVRLKFPLNLGIIIQEIKEISEEKQSCNLSYGVNSCDSIILVKMTVHMAHLVPM